MGEGEAARRAALGGGSDGPTAAELYAASEFCLVLPGHVYDLGRRFYDIVAHGCIPVVVALAPMFVSVPFSWQLPWTEIAVFGSVASAQDAGNLLQTLLAAAWDPVGRARIAARRAALVKHAPALFLPPHSQCPAGTQTATYG